MAKNFDTIRVGNEYKKSNNITHTYLVELTTQKNNTLYIELSKDGDYWNINSVGIFRKRLFKK